MIPGDIIASHMFHKWGGYNLINPGNVKKEIYKCQAISSIIFF